jgi:hypothetical protein
MPARVWEIMSGGDFCENNGLCITDGSGNEEYKENHTGRTVEVC